MTLLNNKPICFVRGEGRLNARAERQPEKEVSCHVLASAIPKKGEQLIAANRMGVSPAIALF